MMTRRGEENERKADGGKEGRMEGEKMASLPQTKCRFVTKESEDENTADFK